MGDEAAKKVAKDPAIVAKVKYYFTDKEWQEFSDEKKEHYIGVYVSHWELKKMGKHF